MILKPNEVIVHICSNCGRYGTCASFDSREMKHIGTSLLVDDNLVSMMNNPANGMLHLCEYCEEHVHMKVQKAQVILL